jgi:serine/threonine protein kinase
MGVVYRGQDPAIGRVVAIKTIRLADLTDGNERQRMRDRLFREAQSAGMLSHPNIVTIYDIAEENGLAYIFMEFVNGPSLERLLEQPEPVAREKFLTILRQTAYALDYAHSKGIVHRDIKPANIMVHDDGQAKITDFGVAKIVSQQMTQTGAMMGTPSYMSPEQVQGQTVDGRADQFALAVIAYEVFTGEKPFAADYLPTLLYRIVSEQPTAPHRLNPSIGPEVEAVLTRALAKDPRERFPTCGEFSNALMEAVGASPAWKPLRSGASQGIETIAATELDARGMLPADLTGDSATVMERTAPVSAVATATSPGTGGSTRDQPTPPLAPPVNLPPPARQAVLDDSDSNPLFKNVAKVSAIVVAAGAIYIGVHYYMQNQGKPAPASTTAPAAAATTSPTGAKTAAPAAATAPTPSSAAATKPPEPPPAPQQTPENATQPKAAPREEPAVAERRSEPAATPAARTSQVQFVSSPAGATITVDGDVTKQCQAPCAIALPAGRHTMVAELGGRRPSRKIFQSPKDSEIFIQLDAAGGMLLVTSTPPGGSIFVDGKESGKSTPASVQLPVGRHQIVVLLEGRRAQNSVDMQDGSVGHMDLKLQ